MPFTYATFLTNVYNCIKDHNTTTASPDLSNGLDVRIDDGNILKTDPEIEPPRADRLPAVYIRIADKTEESAGLGATGSSGVKKEAIVTYDVIGIYGKYGGWSPHSELLTDIYTMAENIEGVFQTEYTLSNTALYVNPIATEFSAPIDLGSEGFAKVVLIRLEAHYLFR